MEFQHTLNHVVVCAGIGVHSGARAKMTIRPADTGFGIVFRRVDMDNPGLIYARGDNVRGVQLGTTLVNEAGQSVATVEHLLAACAGVGLDNAIIDIDGPEVPIMDGSAALFCEMFLKAGLKQQQGLRRKIRIIDTIEVRDGQKWARLMPSHHDILTLSAQIEFQTKAIGTQEMTLRLDPGMFSRDIAFARTFGFAADVEMLKAKGLARGGSLENAVVIDGDEILNPEGLRSDDEFVRHKLLDAVGDLMLAGAPIAGNYEAFQPGHAMNNLLVRELLQRSDAWVWETATADVSAQPLAAV